MHYQRPTLDDFREVRRGLPVLAAALFAVSLLFPMWHIEVHAVQYPDTVLHLRLYAYPRISGDYVEMARLNKYVGFYYPDPVYWQPNYEVHPRAVDVPEWSFGPLAFLGASALSAFVAVAPTSAKLERGLRYQLVATVAVFGVMIADIQYRLYQAGHELDPGAPVMGVEGFTPPLWGTYKVANITSHSRFGSGASLAATAVASLVVAYYYREEPVTIEELPSRVRTRLQRASRRAGIGPLPGSDAAGRGDAGDQSDPGDGAAAGENG